MWLTAFGTASMGKHDFEIQPAPEPPDPEAKRAPRERTALQNWVTRLTLIPLVACTLVALAYGWVAASSASAEIVRTDRLLARAAASVAPYAADLQHWGTPVEVLKPAWHATQAERRAALHGHRTACRILVGLALAAVVPALVIWSRGQFGRPEGAWRVDLAQIGMCLVTVALLIATAFYDAGAVSVLSKTRPTHDIGDYAAAMIAAAKAEELDRWREPLENTLAALRPPLAPNADPSCDAATVEQLMAESAFELLSDDQKRGLRVTLQSLAKTHYAGAAFDALARSQLRLIGPDAVAAILAEHERETKQFADDAEAAEYFFDAIETNDEAAVRMMLRRGMDPNVRDPRPGASQTPLYAAVRHRRPILVRLLLEHGADPDLAAAPGPDAPTAGDHPTHAAVGDAGLMKLLLEHCADPDVKDAAGRTPLHYAAAAGDRASIKLLAAHLADLNALDANCQTPLDLTNDPRAGEAAHGANPLLQHLGALTSADLARRTDEASLATTPQQ